MSSAKHFMPLYVGDYLADTAHLTAAEHGAYLLLIMHYWRTGALPNDDAQLARIARCSKREWEKARPVIAAFFDDEWKHERIAAEMLKAEEAYKRRAKAGRRGGEAKAMAKQKPSIATAMNKQPEPEPYSPKGEERERGARGTRLSPDWVPTDELISFAKDLGMPHDRIENETAKFRDYWNGVAGAKGTKLDWDGTWRNWIRRSCEGPRPVLAGKTSFDANLAALARSGGYGS